MNRLNQISQVNQMNPDVLQQLGFGEGEVSALNTGFGFIQRPNFPDLFFHFSEWPRPQDQIAIGTKIRFECVPGKKDRLKAVKIKIIDVPKNNHMQQTQQMSNNSMNNMNNMNNIRNMSVNTNNLRPNISGMNSSGNSNNNSISNSMSNSNVNSPMRIKNVSTNVNNRQLQATRQYNLDFGCYYTVPNDASAMPLFIQIYPLDGLYNTKATQLNEKYANKK